jgi:hypothetical protein
MCTLKRKEKNKEDREDTRVQGPSKRQLNECPYCGMIGPSPTHCCSLEQIPWEIVKNIGTYLPTKDLGKFALASRGMYRLFEELGPVRSTLELNSYKSMRGKFRKNAYNEGNAARVLFVSDPESFKKWEKLSEEEKQNYRKEFSSKYSKEGGGPNEAGGTPDFIFRNRITDVFTVAVSSMAPDKCKDALRAVKDSLVPKALEKWNNYGVGTTAVADISEFPSDLPTQAVINAILEQAVINKRFNAKLKAREKEKLGLMLIRNLELTEVYFH